MHPAVLRCACGSYAHRFAEADGNRTRLSKGAAHTGSRVRAGAAPNVMATLRNLVIGLLCRAGPVNVAAALRRHARDPRRALTTLGIRSG
jgi:hypothetical protein